MKSVMLSPSLSWYLSAMTVVTRTPYSSDGPGNRPSHQLGAVPVWAVLLEVGGRNLDVLARGARLDLAAAHVPGDKRLRVRVPGQVLADGSGLRGVPVEVFLFELEVGLPDTQRCPVHFAMVSVRMCSVTRAPSAKANTRTAELSRPAQRR